MALITGSAMGTTEACEEIYMSIAPYVYYQDYTAPLMYSPDANGFYWQLTGTAAYPVYELCCVAGVSLTENITINDVMCDNVGVRATVQERNYLEFTFTNRTFFPFQVLTHVLKGGAVTEAGGLTQQFGLGTINNQQFWHVWLPIVYDTSVGDYVGITLMKAQLVNPFTWNMPFGTPHEITGVTFRAMADTTKPSAQQFASVLRADLSAV